MRSESFTRRHLNFARQGCPEVDDSVCECLETENMVIESAELTKVRPLGGG